MPYKKGGRLIGGFPSQRQPKRRPKIATKKDKKPGANVAGQSPYAIPAPNPK